MRYPEHLLKLVEVLKRFPGVGNKTAQRFAFHLLNWQEKHLQELGDLVSSTKLNLKQCGICGCLMGNEGCFFCESSTRNKAVLCVIASPRDAFSIEETGEYRGYYHVLGGLLSPLERRGPETLNLEKLKVRLEDLEVKELIIALDSTLEGDATALYIRDQLSHSPIKISRLAFGLPMGSSLEYADEGTLARAFSARNQF